MAVYAGEIMKEPLLMNDFSLIMINPERYPHVNVQDAQLFAEWLMKGDGRNLIADYGKKISGRVLFFVPDKIQEI